MPLTSTIVHPRLFRELALFLPSTCTIKQATVTVSDMGEESKTWAVLAGHEVIACSLASKAGNTQEQASERRTAESTYDAKTRHCSLDGYYPSITEGMIAVVDSTEYDIRGVVNQSIAKQTKLMLELIT